MFRVPEQSPHFREHMVALVLGKWNHLAFVNFARCCSSSEKEQPNGKHVFQPKHVLQL
jgi:hypothetical protein